MGKGRLLTDEEVVQMAGKKVFVEFRTLSLLPSKVYIPKWIENKKTFTFMTEDFRCSFDFNTVLGKDAMYYEYIKEPRTYKTSEMIAMLEENQDLKFKECCQDEHIVYVTKDGVIKSKINGNVFYELSLCVDDTFVIFNEPKEVTFLEAINQDKPISNKRGTIKRCKPSWIISEGFLTLNDFNDKWYIMEESK